MNPALLIRLRPLGPWRFGPSSGARDRVDLLLHSDVVFSAVSIAAEQLGFLDEWLSATARAGAPQVAVSSLYPFQGRTLFAIPPRNLWPPAAVGRVRWKGARFVPTSVVQAILRDQALQEERWAVDPISQCLLSTDRSPSPSGPFRIAVRSAAAVDRVTQGAVDVHSTACLEFAEAAGLWCVATFSNEDSRSRWSDRLKAVFRVLADSGVGGERSRGWGRASEPEFSEGDLNDLLFPPSQKLKDIRPKKPASVPEATVTTPPVTEPLSAALNPPLDPAQPDVQGEGQSFGGGSEPDTSLNPPLDPVQPDAHSFGDAGGSEPDTSLNPPLDPVQPDLHSSTEPRPSGSGKPAEAFGGAGEAETSLNPPLDPVQPDAQAGGHSFGDAGGSEPDTSLNPPLDPVQPDLHSSTEPRPSGSGEPAEAFGGAGEAETSLNPPLDPVQPDAHSFGEEGDTNPSLNPPLDPVQPDTQPLAPSEQPEPPAPTEEPEPQGPPEEEPEPEAPPEEEPGPEPSPHTEPGPEPPPQSAITWEPPEEPKPGKAYWLLSLFAPSPNDSVDWSRGNYSLIERSGRVHSRAAFGRLKQVSQMVEEGSVVISQNIPSGVAQDVAPEGCAHPVYRTGFAVSLEIPWRVQA